VIDIAKIADAEQQAEMATLQRDLAIAQNQLRNLRDKSERLEADNEDLSQRLLKRAKRDGESSMLMDRLSNLRVDLREMERARDEAANEVAGLQAMVHSYEERLGSEEDAIDTEAFESLKEELETLREKSRRDLQDLQDQLDQQSEQVSSNVDSQSVLEIEVLRQEHDVLKNSLADRQSELQSSQQTCQLLEDELEDAHTEIDELRRQLEQHAAEIERAEKELENKNAETVAEMLAENMKQEEELNQSVPVLGIDSATVFGVKQKAILLVMGLVLGIVLMEVTSFAMGKGELFGYLSRDVSRQQETAAQKIEPKAKVSKPVEQSQEMQSGQIIRN
jgi:chromosome segregation ATPase